MTTIFALNLGRGICVSALLAVFPITIPISARGTWVHQQSEISLEQATMDTEFQKDVAILESFRLSRDFVQFQAIVARDSVKWQQTDRKSFVSYMLKVCALLSSYDLGDLKKQPMLLNHYAMSVLEGGELSLEQHAEFVEFLAKDPIGLDAETWARLRRAKARLWLGTWRRLAKSIDPNFDSGDLPLLNVSPPPGSAVSAGAAPEAIRDPKLRGEYERAIALNAAKANRYNEQHWLKQNAPSFFKEAETYLVNAYATPPADLSELGRLLSEYIDSEDVRKRVIEAVRKREQN